IVEAVARQQELWARLCTFIELNSTQPGRQGWLPDAVVAFFTVERSLEEVIEALLEQEEIWNHVRLWLKMLMDQMVQPAVYGTVLPWSKAACVRYFGGEKPTRADVERAFEQGEIRGMMKKWTGYYSVIYEHDVPYEIVFAGFSGD
ncbi:MAG: hypothetical protein J2P36_23275, partial [Ktedonobacteraceae bacterium]|nr:hypothetical protein [Ktedonobacteraceae bacterium]